MYSQQHTGGKLQVKLIVQGVICKISSSWRYQLTLDIKINVTTRKIAIKEKGSSKLSKKTHDILIITGS